MSEKFAQKQIASLKFPNAVPLALRPRRARRGVNSPQSAWVRVLKVVWSSGAEVQKRSLAPVQALFAPVQTSFASVQETFSALPHQRPKPPFALSPNHFGAIWGNWLRSVPAGVALPTRSDTERGKRADLFEVVSQSRKCAINNFWTKNSAGLFG